MEFETIRFEEKDGLAWITLSRPPDNRINVRMIEEIEKAIHLVEDESDARAVIFCGGDGVFSRGIDLADFPKDAKPDVYGFSKWEKMLRQVEKLGRITIAAIDGECLGGGAHLLLACDIRVATARASFCLHEARLGFLPGMTTFRLAKFIGLGRARRMALTGRRVDAAEAERIGLVDHLAAGTLEDAIEKALAEFSDFHPDSVELIKRLLDESFSASYEDFLGGFLAAQHRAIQSEAFKRLLTRKHGG